MIGLKSPVPLPSEGSEQKRGPALCRVPLATYRLQFNRQFTFQQATDLAGYLAELGISDCYASPLGPAGPESTHGYDTCGFDRLNPNLGTPADFERFVQRLRQLGLGLLLDIVPNHMRADLSNPWWADVLEHGEASPYATWFDIDWQPCHSDLQGKVLLPVLEDHYGKVLAEGKLKVVFDEGALAVAYYDHKFPLAPRSYPLLLEPALAGLQDDSLALKRTRELLDHLQRVEHPDLAAAAELKRELADLNRTVPGFRIQLKRILKETNGEPGVPESFTRLHALLRQQCYRLAWWRAGPEEINYRRFFDIASLVSLKMELPEVFQAAHQLLFQALRQNQVTGLRIDHPDGLWDPRQYFQRLQEAFAESLRRGAGLYIVAEKILTGDEMLPADWPVSGTTGYDFLNQVNGLFVDSRNRAAFDALYSEITGERVDFSALVYSSKEQVLRSSFCSELKALAHRLKRIAARSQDGQDLTFEQLEAALAGIIAGFPVYRTYLAPGSLEVHEQVVRAAVQAARNLNPDLDDFALEFVERVLLLELPEETGAPTKTECLEWIMHLQQLTGPVMAKGVEDTAFYRFNRLVSLNEVGGDPNQFGIAPEMFHQWNARRLQDWPHSLSATATHDTKRGEDLRARLNVLSEMPEEWRAAVQRWSQINASKKSMVDGQAAPHPNDEILFYQMLLGAWLPEAESAEGLKDLAERLGAYMIKAIREAKARTSWTDLNPAYEAAMKQFVDKALTPDTPNLFLDDFRPFQRRVAFFGVFNSLSQLLLKLTCPGVPDFYQGTELWDFSLVDPDNRRPVDYEVRRGLLEQMKNCLESGEKAALQRLLREPETGEIKLYVTWRGLEFRKCRPDLFLFGSYKPLVTTGPRKDHVCAFARTHDGASLIAIAPRLCLGLTGGAERWPIGPEIWQDTAVVLPPGPGNVLYRNLFTGELVSSHHHPHQLAVAGILASFPIALLEPCNE